MSGIPAEVQEDEDEDEVVKERSVDVKNDRAMDKEVQEPAGDRDIENR